jgi:hypothetical protein
VCFLSVSFWCSSGLFLYYFCVRLLVPHSCVVTCFFRFVTHQQSNPSKFLTSSSVTSVLCIQIGNYKLFSFFFIYIFKWCSVLRSQSCVTRADFAITLCTLLKTFLLEFFSLDLFRGAVTIPYFLIQTGAWLRNIVEHAFELSFSEHSSNGQAIALSATTAYESDSVRNSNGFSWLDEDSASHVKYNPMIGRTKAQAVSRCLPTAAVMVRARVRTCGICGEQSVSEAGFPRVLRIPLPIFIPPTAPSVTWGRYNRPVVVAVLSGLSLTPLRIIIKKTISVPCSPQEKYTDRANSAWKRS